MRLLRRLWLITRYGETELCDLGLGGALAVFGGFIALPGTEVFALPSFRHLAHRSVPEPAFGAVYLAGGLFKLWATLSLRWRWRLLSAGLGCGLWTFAGTLTAFGNPDSPLWPLCLCGAAASAVLVVRHALDRAEEDGG